MALRILVKGKGAVPLRPPLPLARDRCMQNRTLTPAYLSSAVQALQDITPHQHRLCELPSQTPNPPHPRGLLPLLCAGAGEIDQGLFDLMQQNIDSARAAGQGPAADFMEKVLLAAKRYSV